MIFNGVESNKLLKRDNILDLFCAAQFLAVKGVYTKNHLISYNNSDNTIEHLRKLHVTSKRKL